jgi:hypothetical protein
MSYHWKDMRRRSILVFVAICTASACNRDVSPVGVPTPIAKPTITENYSGTLFVLGSNVHFFEVKLPSEVDVTLTAVATVPVTADPSADPPVVGVPAAPVGLPLKLRVGQSVLTTIGVQCSDLMSISTPSGTCRSSRARRCPAPTKCRFRIRTTSCGAVTYAITVAHS